MIVLFALLGAVAGWLLAVAGDYLIRFGEPSAAPPAFHRPALLRAVTREPLGQFGLAELVLEILSAALFALVYALHGLSLTTLWLLLVYAFFALITIMDFKYRVVLNILTYPGLIVALAVNLLVLQRPPLPILLGAVFGFAIFYLTARVMPDGMGGGDIKLATLIGAALGFPQVLFALIVMAAASALTIIFLLVSRGGGRKTAIPYAPFLCLGVVVVLVYTSLPTLP
jgi:leader peptidase (prepilin peptidase)/N-methyltransferase